MREYGILFPNSIDKHYWGYTEELEKTYSFDDSTTVHHFASKENQPKAKSKFNKMVSHKKALELDAIFQNFILKYF